MEEVLKVILLGVLQGLAEFLPISSSGHLEIGKALFGIDFKEDNLLFTTLLHGATVLSTIIVFRKDILDLLKGLLKFKWNEEAKFTSFVLVSMLPVLIVGLFFKNEVEHFFSGNINFVGYMLIFTGVLLMLTKIIPSKNKELNYINTFIIGISQAIAVLPGISRSGATISTGLLLGIDKSKMARFSFLMVIPPILGAIILDIKDVKTGSEIIYISYQNLILGSLSAFITGLFACKIMIDIVKKGKIQYFAYYCFAVGLLAIFLK